MTSYFFILSGSFFIKFNNKDGGEDCKSAQKILFTLVRLSKIYEGIKVFTVYETDKTLEEEVQDKKAYYNLLSKFYDVAKSYIDDEFNAIVKLAKDKSKEFSYVIIINGSNAFENEFNNETEKNILIKSEIDTLKYIIDEISI